MIWQKHPETLISFFLHQIKIYKNNSLDKKVYSSKLNMRADLGMLLASWCQPSVVLLLVPRLRRCPNIVGQPSAVLAQQ